MRSTVRPSGRPSGLRNDRAPRFIFRHLTVWLVLFTLGAAVVLASVLAGARDESRKRTARAEQQQGAKSVTKVLSANESVKLERHGNSYVRGAYRERLAAELFVNPPAPSAGGIPATSSARLRATPNNDQADPGGKQEGSLQSNGQEVQARGDRDKANRKPREERLTKAHSFNGDLRDLPHRKPAKRERPEREEPERNPTMYPGTSDTPGTNEAAAPSAPTLSAPAPPAIMNFDGLDFANWGAGHPPDTNGDVGPTYYIQTVNTSIGIFRKSDGVRVAALTFNTFMSQGAFGNLCDTNNFGDPVVLYDSFEDRWIITDFAFALDGSNNVINPPGSFQCIAASNTGDPVAGGWNFYSINTAGGLGDYPKFGIWPDGLYMSVNMFNYAAGGAFQNSRVYAFNKAQMYAGAPAVQSVSFDAPAADFAILPSNARLQTGTPPLGRPNYFVSTEEFLNGLTVYKLHADWTRISLSTFTGPDVPIGATSWPNAAVPNAPSLGGNALDVLSIRAMMQNQYTNIGGAESLWTTHTVRRGNTSGFAAPRWYQVNVTGGSVAANLPQAATWDPDGANVIYRFLPSLAVDRAGNMALGYSTSSSTTKPAIKYAGRLATDPINTLGQTEQLLMQGTGTQLGSCGTTCARWGDYSAMSLDPDGCTFWYTNEYYAVDGLNDLTRIGSFSFPQCTAVGVGGTVTGTVTDSATSNPISGATVALGSRSTTTDAGGGYIFSNLPAGTYPSITASFVAYGSASATSIVVNDAATTTQNFSLTAAVTNACPVDTSQADFQTGVSANIDLNTSPGDVILSNPSNIDQRNTTISGSGVGITITTWAGQTFTAGVTGLLTRADINLFCSTCTGTFPNLTLSLRDTSGNLPAGPDLASATITGFNSGAGVYYTANFASPPTLTAGTVYALLVRPTANPSAGTYALTRSSTNVYAGGQRVQGASSGTVWTAPLTAGQTTDAGFTTYINNGFALSGNQISGLKDANPAVGFAPLWTTLSWTATTPANTTMQFQAAASNSVNGPFNFAGPDGTGATFFTTSGASLSQFNGFRYLKYKALLSTTNSTTTPTLNDVTACFNDDVVPVITAAAPISRQQGPAAINSQIASVSDGDQAANTLTVTTTPLTGTGVTISNISLDGSGNVTADVAASCTATDSTVTLTVTDSGSAMATATLTVNVTASATPTITPGGPTTFCAGGSVTLASSNAGGNQWFLNGNPIGGATNQAYNATASGDYTVTANSCTGNPSAATVTVNPIPATPTITPGGPTTFCAGGSVTITSSSASGNQWFLNGNPIGGATNQNYVATGAGDFTDTVTTSSCISATSTATAVTVNPIPATPTITPGGPTTFCAGNSVTITSSSASGNQWYLNGNPIGRATNQNYVATGAGDFTDTVTTSGCTSAPSTATVVTVNPIPATPTITPGGPTTFCAGNSVTITSSSASGNQWYSNGSPIGGATNQNYVATGAGDFTDIVMISDCASASSTPTTVTVSIASPVVTTNADSGAGSLRQALLDACDGSTITFDMNQVVSPITLTSGSLSVDKSLTVQGPGADLLTVTRSAAVATPEFRVFDVSLASPGAATISGLTISNGQVNGGPGQGAGILNNGTGTLNVIGAMISNNSAGLGGGIFGNTGTTTNITNSTLSGNSAAAGGGAICLFDTATVNLTNSTLSGNSAGTGNGGGILSTNTGIVNVTSSTLSGNSAVNGGGLLNNAGTMQIRNTIVAVNSATNSGSDVLGTITSLGHNLIGESDGSTGLTNGTNGDIVGTSAAPINPLLGSLANNGGPTLTLALLPGSVALDTGDNCVTQAAHCGESFLSRLTTDQRGFARITNTTVDIGAFESRGFTFSITSGSSQSTPVTTAFAAPLVAMVSSPFGEPVAGGVVTFTAPGSGASGAFAGNVATSTIDAGGGATSATFTANGTGGGPYNIVASIGTGLPTLNFALTNLTGNQTIVFGALANKTFGEADFGVSASATSGLAVSFSASGQCTVAGSNVHLTGAGSCTITASQAGDTNHNAATNVPQSFTIGKSNQTITFGSLANKTFGDADFTVSATATSGLTVGFSASGQCTVGGSIVHLTGAGSCTITASQAGDTNYNTATNVPQSCIIGNSNQTVTFGSLANKTFGEADFTVSATATSGLTVGFSASGQCTVGGSIVHLTGAGSCTITASQGGDTNFNAAINVPQSFTIANSNQTITFGALANKMFGDADFTLSATATSGLTVGFSASGQCTVAGTTVHLTGAGSCTITASQGGDTNHNAAANVPQGFTIANSNQTITFGALANKTFDDPDFTLSATATSVLTVRFASTGDCTVTDSTVHITGVGSCTITASQAGDSNYNAATDVPQGFTIAKSDQTITFAVLANKTFGDADFAVTGTSDSSLALSFAGSDQCTVSGSMVHIMAAGSCTITASQAGDSNFNAATSVPQSFTITSSGLITLSQSNYSVNESTGFVTITVNRTGDLSIPVSVDYATDDTGASNVCSTLNSGLASARCDFGLTLGTLNFAATETQKTFMIPITQDSFAGGPEMFTVNLSNPTGAGVAFASPSSATVTINDSAAPAPNANDDPDAFVRQHYRDFLNREADPAGLAFWTNEITSCGSDAACRDIKRTNVSAAFFLSIEFQATGNLVRNLYVAALDRAVTNDMPAFVEFWRDTQAMQSGLIVGQGNWQQTLKDNRDAFMKDFVTRGEFVGLYPATDTPAQYVNKLYLHAGITPAAGERSNAIAEFGSATTAADAGARGRALFDVTQNPTFQTREVNRSYVQMEYFGYLRRNPNDAPDGNLAGYDFWVNKLNAAGGNFVAAEMVKSFLVSGEYRRRFGP